MSYEYHAPVLTEEVIRYLKPERNGGYVDGTLGGAGHAEAILMSNVHTTVIGFDMDDAAIDRAQTRLTRFGQRVHFVQDNVANLRRKLSELNIDRIDGLLLDLGVSSRQLDQSDRGFSFQHDGRIDMRMDRRQSLDGWKVVNTYTRERLADVFWQFGEERNSRRIAAFIADAREKQPIDSTAVLARVVEAAIGPKFLQKTLARVFQSIRIEVNQELENLTRALEDSLDLITSGGCIVVISYHSLEDRIVKQFFRNASRKSIRSATALLPDIEVQPRLSVLTTKPVVPGDEEVKSNPRAKSAKLRAAEKI